MKDTQANRRHWSRRQQALRRALMDNRDVRTALPIFLEQHAAIHSAALGSGWSYQDEVLRGLAGDRMRLVPEACAHSALWCLWHITRIEDVTVNILLAESDQVLHRAGWAGRLRAPFEDVANELPPAALAALNRAVDVKALLAYRLAVGRRTRAVVQDLDPRDLWSRPASGRLDRLRLEGAVNERETWLLKYWGGHPAANLLMMPATRHAFVHLNEIRMLRTKLQGEQDL